MTSTNWYFTKSELYHGMNSEEIKSENANRKITCAFLQDAGMQLRLPQLTIATAVVFFHRFFVRHKLRDFERMIIAATCLFLAAKVEETPKKLKDVIEIMYTIKYKKEIKPDSMEFQQLKDQILTNELIVLQTIAFDLTVEHPYKFLLTYVKGIKGNRQLAQVAWNFVNDSLRTTLCLQFKPQLIASAAIYLASKFLKYDLPEGKNKPWWEVLDAKIEDLDEISNQILDLYDSTPNVDAMKPKTNFGENSKDEFSFSRADFSNELSTTTTTTTTTDSVVTSSSPNSSIQQPDSKSISSTVLPSSSIPDSKSSSSTSTSTSTDKSNLLPTSSQDNKVPTPTLARSDHRSRSSRSPPKRHTRSSRSRSPKHSPRDRSRSRSPKRSRSPRRSRSRSPKHSRSRSRSPTRRNSNSNRHDHYKPGGNNNNNNRGYKSNSHSRNTHRYDEKRYHPYDKS